MFDDDLDPKTKKPKPRSLDKMSVEDLREYINDLKAEIARAEADIAKKQAHKDAAALLFKSKTD